MELPRDHVSAGAFIERTIRDALHTGAEEEDVERLVDAKDNEFVISNPKSGTMELQQDLRLIRDLVVVLVAAAIGAVAFTMMGQPLITGYLVAGAAVGPGGLGLVVELVQVRLLPVRPRSRCERRSLRTFPVVTLHPRFPFNV